MEPRQLWARHAVLAEAFCGTDERVRQTKSVLDEAQAERSQMLAAFAVTVGDDDAVAQMMGLTEREVRLARRTVGKDAARARAETLLAGVQGAWEELETDPPVTTAPEVDRPHSAQAPLQHGPPQGWMTPVSGMPAPAPGPVLSRPQPYGAQAPLQQGWMTSAPGMPASAPGPVPSPDPASQQPQWSPAMDAVLVGAWQSQVDLTVLAAELGLDLQLLAARAQQLSVEGRLRPPGDADGQAGRHRRGGAQAGFPMQDPSAPPVPTQAGVDQGWQHWQWQQQTETPWHQEAMTPPARDWEGILNQWQVTQPAGSA